MALRTPLTAQPHLYIGDSTGRPLDYGRVYFGEPNKDPEFYPIDIYLDPEMTIAAAQPVRTKGGFMDVGGNLAELHAAEVIYSLKVLDQYGRQVFYKPEMYRNNVSDLLTDEIIRATAAETLIAGNLTAETQRAVAAEKVIADAVVAEKDRAVAAEDALYIKHAALSSTINSLGGGKKAYTTYALMVADKNNIAANSSIDVTNDTDPLKNGTYSYDGAVFAKSIYDIETIVRAKVLNTFKTKALMDASALPDGADAQVTNDTANNGLYVKVSGAWVKSAYDPLSQAKADATTKADAAKIYADDNKLAKTAVDYAYAGGNLIGAKTKLVSDRGLNAAGSFTPPSGSYASGILAVNKGDTLYILNSIESYSTGTGHGALFHTDDPSINPSAVKIADYRQQLTDEATNKKYLKVTVPDTAKFLVFNTRFNATIIDWAIHKDAFSSSYVTGKAVFKGINGAFIEVDERLNATKKELLQGNSIQGDLYTSDGILPVSYINSKGDLATGQATWEAFKFRVDEGGTYFIKVTIGVPYAYFFLKYSTSYLASTSGESGTVRGNVALMPTQQANIYKFTVPTGQDIKAVFMNTSMNEFDIRTTLSIQKNSFDDNKVGVSTSAINSINGNVLVDTYAREQLALKSNGSRLQGKKVWALGDSITDGTMGGYVKYLSDIFGTNVKNIGASGARANRVADIVMGGAGFPRRDTATEHLTWEEQDFTDAAAVTLMIGTNDASRGTWGSVDALPTDTLADYATPAEYWALFPNDYIGNIALVIEYIKSKSPKCEIHLVTPTRNRDEETRPNYGIETARTHMIAVANKYSAHLIDAQNESGLDRKFMRGELNIYSYDGTHLNEQGNEVFGKFLAQKVLSFG